MKKLLPEHNIICDGLNELQEYFYAQFKVIHQAISNMEEMCTKDKEYCDQQFKELHQAISNRVMKEIELRGDMDNLFAMMNRLSRAMEKITK